MREIKFRGEREDGNGFAFGFYVKDGDGTYIISDEEGDDRGEWYRVIPETVGEFTGLQDRNGKRIYEGDVVKCICCDEDEILYEIICRNDCGYAF